MTDNDNINAQLATYLGHRPPCSSPVHLFLTGLRQTGILQN